MSTAIRKSTQRLLVAGLSFLALNCGLLVGYFWYQASPLAQSRALAQARARWEARPFERYHLHVTQDASNLLPIPLEGTYPVEDEALDVRQQGIHQRSISSHFRWLERYPMTVDFICPDLDLDIACTGSITYHVQADYDEQLGYPRRITFLQTSYPELDNPSFWQHGRWQQCDNLLCATTRSTTITIELQVANK